MSWKSFSVPIILLATSIVSNCTTAKYPFSSPECCETPIFGIGPDSCGNTGCATCIIGEFIVKKQDSNGFALPMSKYLRSASRIVLEDIKDVVAFENLQTLIYDGTDSEYFPEPLIRIRRTTVSEKSFSKLEKIEVNPLNPYCEKGTIFDIDRMHPTPLKKLRDLEKKILQACTTKQPPPCLPFIQTGLIDKSSNVTFKLKPEGEKEKSDCEDCNCEGTIMLAMISICWVFVTLGIGSMVFMCMQAKKAEKRSESVSFSKCARPASTFALEPWEYRCLGHESTTLTSFCPI
ncbi:unnamed protein product [Caenorhabditis auriculariae]|uniref:Uncharacterized protein n=1 Tax=Caenorhabditis auriculariae TaxID=2777116 RepID=A0A8S1H5A0_9PELO|nr:unnamed protein product [Caenorhabditis auriculariae]